MNVTKKQYRLLFMLALGVLGASTLRYGLRTFNNAPTPLITIAGYLTNETEQLIHAYIHAALAQSPSSLIHLAQGLKEHFPCIQSVTVAHISPQILDLTITPHIPHYAINADMVSTREGTVVAKSLFPSFYTEQLPTVNLSPSMNPHLFARYAAYLSPLIFEHYRIHWQDESHAWLTDKDNPQFSILFHGASIPDSGILATCAQIKNNLALRGVWERKKKKALPEWIADVRFKNQIVVFARNGG
jgi:hypothetical protein